jgi:hypothetical protein
MFRTTIALTGLLIVATPAAADWQYAKWGMTADQLTAASKGQMKRCGAACEKQKTDAETALLYAPYTSGDLDFTAFAFFNNQTHKLSFVSLRLDDPSKSNQLVGALRAKYGEPVNKSNTQLMSLFVWRDARDQIDVTIIGPNTGNPLADLAYRPRLTDSNKGL